jgi:NAD(P)-dependent dehydrogenase (short-subunit alcohol dehydrogenase family)
VPERLLGKRVLVTGAAAGIGREIALAAAGEGAELLCADLDEAGASATAERAGGAAIAVDVTEPASVTSMGERAGEVDGLAACAGVVRHGSALEIAVEDWDLVEAVNLRGPWLCARALLPGMIRRGGGSIVNVASIAALVGTPRTAAYAASKAGLVGLTRQMAADFGVNGVRVNAISPGTVPTEMSRARYRAEGLGEEEIEARFKRLGERTALGRLGTPGDVAAMAVFLLGDEAGWISGGCHEVDGGFIATRRG